MQIEIIHVQEWLHVSKNTLSVNTNVCGSMLVGTRQSLLHSDELRVELDNELMKDLSESPYLGLYLIIDLTWAKHISKLFTKLSQTVAILGRIKSKVPQVMLEQVYKTIIQPNINYCITVWGYAPNVHVNTVQSLQTRATRIVSGNYDWTIRGTDVVKELKWETVE